MSADFEPPMYFSMYRKLLRTLGLGMFNDPEGNDFENYPTVLYSLYGLFSVILIILFPLSVCGFTYIAWKEEKETSVFFMGLLLIGTDGIEVAKTLIMIKNNKALQRILQTLEVDCMRYARDRRPLERAHRISMIFTWFFLILGNSTVLLMGFISSIPDIERYRELKPTSNTTVGYPKISFYYMWIPWGSDTVAGAFGGYIFSIVSMFWASNVLMTCDTMIASVMTHISAQFVVLQNNIETVDRGALDILARKLILKNDNQIINSNAKKLTASREKVAKKTYEDLLYFSEKDYDRALKQCFKEVVEYHNAILEVSDRLQNAFSNVFLCQIFSSYYVIGLMLVQFTLEPNLSSLSFYATVGYLVSVVWQLFIQTYSGNEVTLQALRVADSAFRSQELYWSPRHAGSSARDLALVIQRAQAPLRVRAGPIAVLSNDTFVTTLKSAYQIFTLIKTTMKAEN